MKPVAAPVPNIREQEIAACETFLRMADDFDRRVQEESRPCWTPQPGPQEVVWNLDCDEIGYGGAAGGGKMLPLDTPIPNPDGWTAVGELQPGSVIFSERGEPTLVLAVHPMDPAPVTYEVTFDDGTQMCACADHLWLTFNAAELAALTRRDPGWRAARRVERPRRVGGNKSAAFTAAIAARNAARPTPCKPPPSGTVRTTMQIAASLRTKSGRTNHAIQIAEALRTSDRDLVLAPYLLGVWLGDGTSKCGAITTVDHEIVDEFVRAGFARGATQTNAGRAATYGFLGLQPLLRRLGVLRNKHIPPEYLRASREQRLALLQGLMDTDGTVYRTGSVEFTTTRRALADGAYELIVSLGWKARVVEGRATLKGKDCGPKWDIKWTPSEHVFRLPRKRERQKFARLRTTRFRYIVDCKLVAPVPMRCITVDSPSGLFLAGRSMVPTHNTGLIVAMPMQRLKMRGYRALVLRRSTPDLAKIIDEAKDIYQDGRDAGRFSFRPFAPEPASRWRGDIHWMSFPEWGSRIEFGHCHNLDDYRSRMGQEYDDVLVDEGTQFERIQVVSIASRRRGTVRGIRRRLVITMNPPEKNEPGEGWIRERFAPWIDPECVLEDWEMTDERGHTACGVGLPERVENGRRAPPAASAQLLYVAPIDGKERFSAEPFEWNGAQAQSRTFVRAKLTDNVAMIEAEPNYVAKLRDHDPVRAKQLEDGDWTIRPAAGLYFKREWMPAVEAVPPGRTTAVRRWDLAATEPHAQNPDPDWTSGVCLVKHENGLYYITDIARTRTGPGGVKAFVDATIAADGRDVWQRWAEDPGQAGKSQVGDFVDMGLAHGVNAASVGRETGSKELRIQRVSAAVAPKPGENCGRFRVVPGPWLAFFISQAEGWPEVGHDDDLDALAGAYDALFNVKVGPPAKPIVFGRRSMASAGGM